MPRERMSDGEGDEQDEVMMITRDTTGTLRGGLGGRCMILMPYWPGVRFFFFVYKNTKIKYICSCLETSVYKHGGTVTLLS